jgi:phosphopantothenoylcysteine decarboxylase/phosphopantothenate--cysteine ligase
MAERWRTGLVIDALVVAPATADVIAKFAHGEANDFLTTLFLATTAPVVIAPAMNVNMWENAATQDNLKTLKARGYAIVEPDRTTQRHHPKRG